MLGRGGGGEGEVMNLLLLWSFLKLNYFWNSVWRSNLPVCYFTRGSIQKSIYGCTFFASVSKESFSTLTNVAVNSFDCTVSSIFARIFDTWKR